jgi:hypothetical protein
MEDFMTWAGLLTVAGATAAVLLITQYIKPWLPKLDTRALVFILSILLTQGASFIIGTSWQEHIIMFLNAFVVATAAMGAYEVTFKKSDEAKKLNTPQ